MSNRIQRLLEQAERQKQSAETGASSIASASRHFPETSGAEKFFKNLREKLFRVREWNAEATLTSFELFDRSGNVANRENAVAGDFIRLSMVGAGKNDWVEIIEILDETDEAVVSVKPSPNPTEDAPDKAATSHFFTSDSTNNFCLGKNGETVSFYVIGLSEKTNMDETENFIEKARNVAVSNVGSYLGIQKGEWQTFCENLLKK